ncbi:hypothetical protein FKP32DRAFT_1609307 [Trametes sanguinea]|nr:hypothetical protein FKP32DRAFT_1609307 [Trametes sanguinea]
MLLLQRRKALRLAALKNEQNRTKSHRAAREEALGRSLFERAQEEARETGRENKALGMMMKMGFRPGMALGREEEDRKERERMAKMAEERDHLSFRDRARQEYEERRAVGRLAPAQRTCATLDEKAGIQFNVLWLNAEHPETFPDGLLDALDDPALVSSIQRHRPDHSLEGRLRAKMQADALRPLKSSLEDVDGDDEVEKTEARASPYSEEDLEEARQFLRLNPRDRLTLVLDYLRRKYAYCFWCGTQYDDQEDMEKNCPGPEEDAHD